MTKDLSRRLNEHNSGNVKSTKPFSPFFALHVELAQNLKDARAVEKYLKSGSGRELIKEIEEYILVVPR